MLLYIYLFVSSSFPPVSPPPSLPPSSPPPVNILLDVPNAQRSYTACSQWGMTCENTVSMISGSNYGAGNNWLAVDGGQEDYVEMDLQQSIDLLGVAAEGSGHCCSYPYFSGFRVNVSTDGSSWTTVDDGVTFDGLPYRLWRMNPEGDPSVPINTYMNSNCPNGGPCVERVERFFSSPVSASYVRIMVTGGGGQFGLLVVPYPPVAPPSPPMSPPPMSPPPIPPILLTDTLFNCTGARTPTNDCANFVGQETECIARYDATTTVLCEYADQSSTSCTLHPSGYYRCIPENELYRFECEPAPSFYSLPQCFYPSPPPSTPPSEPPLPPQSPPPPTYYTRSEGFCWESSPQCSSGGVNVLNSSECLNVAAPALEVRHDELVVLVLLLALVRAGDQGPSLLLMAKNVLDRCQPNPVKSIA